MKVNPNKLVGEVNPAVLAALSSANERTSVDLGKVQVNGLNATWNQRYRALVNEERQKVTTESEARLNALERLSGEITAAEDWNLLKPVEREVKRLSEGNKPNGKGSANGRNGTAQNGKAKKHSERPAAYGGNGRVTKVNGKAAEQSDKNGTRAGELVEQASKQRWTPNLTGFITNLNNSNVLRDIQQSNFVDAIQSLKAASAEELDILRKPEVVVGVRELLSQTGLNRVVGAMALYNSFLENGIELDDNKKRPIVATRLIETAYGEKDLSASRFIVNLYENEIITNPILVRKVARGLVKSVRSYKDRDTLGFLIRASLKNGVFQPLRLSEIESTRRGNKDPFRSTIEKHYLDIELLDDVLDMLSKYERYDEEYDGPRTGRMRHAYNISKEIIDQDILLLGVDKFDDIIYNMASTPGLEYESLDLLWHVLDSDSFEVSQRVAQHSIIRGVRHHRGNNNVPVLAVGVMSDAIKGFQGRDLQISGGFIVDLLREFSEQGFPAHGMDVAEFSRSNGYELPSTVLEDLLAKSRDMGSEIRAAFPQKYDRRNLGRLKTSTEKAIREEKFREASEEAVELHHDTKPEIAKFYSERDNQSERVAQASEAPIATTVFE